MESFLGISPIWEESVRDTWYAVGKQIEVMYEYCDWVTSSGEAWEFLFRMKIILDIPRIGQGQLPYKSQSEFLSIERQNLLMNKTSEANLDCRPV